MKREDDATSTDANVQQASLGPASKPTNFATVSTMASMGHIEEFAPGHADWQQWHERLLCYLDANNIDVPEKQRSVFLSVCGSATYSVIRSLVQPKTPTDYTFKELVAKVRQHFNPKPSAIIKRFNSINVTSSLPY